MFGLSHQSLHRCSTSNMTTVMQPNVAKKYLESDDMKSTEYECPSQLRENLNFDLISDEDEGVLSKKSALNSNLQKDPNAKNIMVSHAACYQSWPCSMQACLQFKTNSLSVYIMFR